MATSFQQRKRRATLIGVLVSAAILAVTCGPVLKNVVLGPEIHGYLDQAPSGQYAALAWPPLQHGHWEKGKAPQVDPAVSALDGQPVQVRGFLLPLHTPGAANAFFIAEKPRGCYFCNPPGPSEVVQVDIAGGQKLDFTDFPVTVYGTLHVAQGTVMDQPIYEIGDAMLKAKR